MPAATQTAAPAVDNRKIEAAAKCATRKATREWVKAHNARIEADRSAAVTNATRTALRKDFDASVTDAIKAGAFEIEDVVCAGSPRACAVLGMHEDMTCERCGARISVVYATSHGPLGGDCLATLTGDPSTRRRLQQLARKLHTHALDHDAQFKLSPRMDGGITIERVYLDRGRERIIAIHNGPRAEIVMVLERFGAERGYVAGIFESEREPEVIQVRPRYACMGNIAQETA